MILLLFFYIVLLFLAGKIGLGYKAGEKIAHNRKEKYREGETPSVVRENKLTKLMVFRLLD